MPSLRPRKAPKKEVVEVESSSSSVSSKSPSPAPAPKVKAEKKPRARKSLAKQEQKPEVLTIDDEAEVKPEPQVELEEILYELTEKELKEVNNAFDMNCSEDGDELLESNDLKTALRSLGYEPRADEIKKLLKKYANKKGKINRNGFQKIMALKYSMSPGTKDDMKDAISKVFNLLDLDKKGFITMENLRSISKELNEEITDEELKEMMVEADENGDFMISKDEFCNIMKKTSLY